MLEKKNIEHSEWYEPFSFIQAADTQIGFSDDINWGGRGSGDWEVDAAHCWKLVENINKIEPSPKFLIICGDIVHAMPKGLINYSDGGLLSSSIYSNYNSWKSQNKTFKNIIDHIKIPILYVCGNHDIGDRPTPISISYYESLYGKHFYAKWLFGIRIIVINSQLFNDSSDAQELQDKQEEWLIEELSMIKNKKPKHAIIFQHQPWFINNEDEETGYYNIRKEIRKIWLPRFKESGIKKIFCGHYHRNSTSLTNDKKLEIITTSAVGKQLSQNEVNYNKSFEKDISDINPGMRIIHINDNINHNYYNFI